MTIQDQTSSPLNQEEHIAPLRKQFFTKLRTEVLTWGSETVDIAWTYYPHPHSDESTMIDTAYTPRLVTDRIYLPRLGMTTLDFLQSVADVWWPSRAEIIPEQNEDLEPETKVKAICGFYGRYIGASGFSLVMEFNGSSPESLPQLWRVDARSKGTLIVLPQHEGDSYDQLGAFLDLREGWNWLAQTAAQSGGLVTAEVEPGYLIGVRPGDPLSEEDPAEREDPEIEHVFSRFDAERFDTLEFFESDAAQNYPFQSERYASWFPSELSSQIVDGHLEAFVLSQSQRFIDAVEEVAERRKVELSIREDEEDLILRFQRGPLYIDRSISLPYLWTLHSGRQYHEGAVDFFREDLERLNLASELFFKLSQKVRSPLLEPVTQVSVSDGTTLNLRRESAQRLPPVQVDLLSWAAESVFEGKDGASLFLKLWGWDELETEWRSPKHQLTQCPICQREAVVTRVLRPVDDLASTVSMGSSIDEALPGHISGVYILSCEQHKVPIFWEKGETLREHLSQLSHQVILATSSAKIDLEGLPVELLWGDEIAGTLLDHDTRESLRERGALFAYALTPDLLALSMLPLEEEHLELLEPHVTSVVGQYAPDRDWRLHWHIPLR